MKNNLIVGIIILFVGFLVGSNLYKDKLNISKQNLIAATDSLNIIKNKNNELLYEKSVYIANEKELNNLIGVSKKEIKNLEKKLDSSLSYIAKMKSNIQIDTILVDHFIPIKDSTHYDFIYNDKWFSFNGNLNTNGPILNLYNINIPTSLQIGLTEDNKMFIKPDNPYMEVIDINGSYIIENMANNKIKPKWSHGIQAGFGINYGIGNKSFDFGPYIGYGITYNF